MRRVSALVFWAVLPAAFVGPGTVITCLAAGRAHGTALLYALLLSTLACAALQLAAARIAAASGLELAQAVRVSFVRAPARKLATGLAGLAIGVGCAAYQAGNVLGALAGLELLGVPSGGFTLALLALAAAILLIGSRAAALRASLSLLVGAMGITFVVTAAASPPPASAILAGLFVPSLPAGGTPLLLALAGTTVVPYNLFLGSALAIGRDPRELRLAIPVTVAAGGAISMAILLVGTAIRGELDFQAAASALEPLLGALARPLLGAGIFAAGFTSMVTAPLAAAITLDALTRPIGAPRRPHGTVFVASWIGVLAIGVGFAASGVRPVPAILLAQALNGLLLPLSAALLYLAHRDRRRFGAADPTRHAAFDFALLLAVSLAFLLGALGALRALRAVTPALPDEAAATPWLALLALAVATLLHRRSGKALPPP
jgi:manganese transport protein